MHVAGDLGFSSLVLVLCLVVPAIGFVIRRKWRASAARKEEIKRLLILASDEAARAELEATVSYAAVSVSKNNYQCAVCYCPTTTRCARCKSVRYCSGKCQIIHWRQGHKEECRPARTTDHVIDAGRNSVQKVARQDGHDVYDDRHENVPLETSSMEDVLSNSSCSPGVQLVKDDDINVDSVSETEGTYSISESSVTSFSGFSTYPSHGESSNDVSISESISSNESEGSDIAPAILESSLNKVDQTEPSSPKFASLVDSVHNFNKLDILNLSKSSGKDGEIRCISSSSSGPSVGAVNEGSTTKPAKVSSGFWGRTLDSIVSDNDAQDDSVLSNPSGPANNKSDSESFSHLKFNLSRNDAPSLHAQSLEVNDSIPDYALLSALKINTPVGRAATSENNGFDAPKVSSFSDVRFESSTMDTDLGVPKSSELKSGSSTSSYAYISSSTEGNLVGKDASKVFGSPSSRSEGSNLVDNNPVSTSHLSKSKLSSDASETHLASTISGPSVSNVKFEKVESSGAGSIASSQMASFSPSSINGLKSSMLKVVDQFRGPKCGRYSDKGIFPYDLFVKLYTSNKAEMRPCGLINCGNSCYANAVLQCLAFTPPLTAYFTQGLHSKACVNKEWCFTCEFENLILKAKDGKSPLSPIGILSKLQNIGSQLGNGREEDAHEFLRYAIDAMQSVCLKEAGVNGLGSSEEETTLIGLTFGGYLQSKIKCMKCQYKSERQERMMDLTVEIEGDIRKLEDALRRFSGTEILDGDNKYQCGRCKSYEKAKKKLTILEAPNVLLIALKRFQTGKFGKLNKSIQFPEILDLAPYMSGTSDKSPIYRLYGVIVHLDVMNAAFSGHYVCYVKNIQNKWFKIDDSMVTAVELERVLTKGAYMLLYARCSPRAPRVVRNRILSPDLKSKNVPSRIYRKNATLNSRSSSTPLSVVLPPNLVAPDNLANVESFYLKFHRLQKILEEDSSSDSYSFTSSNSDEGSCSTDSTRNSTSNDDLSDYIFGGWNSSWRNASESDTSSSSSSSPLYSRHSSLAATNQSVSGPPEMSRSGVGHSDPWDRIIGRISTSADMEGQRGGSFLHSDTIKPCRKLGSSSSCRDNDSAKIGWVNPLIDVKPGVPFRKSVSKRTD